MRNFRSNYATSSCPHKPLEVPKCEEKLTIHLLLLNPAIMVNVMRKLGKKTERMPEGPWAAGMVHGFECTPLTDGWVDTQPFF